jgi:hypothetical protein
MKKDDFEKLEKVLLKNGYKKHNAQWYDEDFIIFKKFYNEENQQEKDNTIYSIDLSIYDYDKRRFPRDMKNTVNIEIRIVVSRETDERIALNMRWLDDTDIMEVEAQAEEFYKWVNFVWFMPRTSYKKVDKYNSVHEWLNDKIEYVTERARKCFQNADINTLAQLIEYDEEKLLKLEGCGKKTLYDIKEFLEYNYLHFGIDMEGCRAAFNKLRKEGKLSKYV